MSENKITIITDVNLQDNQKKAENKNTENKGNPKDDNELHENRKKALQRICNLSINYMVIYHVVKCMDLWEYLCDEYEWLPLFFVDFEDEKKTTNKVDLTLLDRLLEIYEQDVTKHKEAKIQNENTPQQSKICKDAVQKLVISCNKEYVTNNRLETMFEVLHDLFGLSYNILTGERQINLGIQLRLVIKNENGNIEYKYGAKFFQKTKQQFEDFLTDKETRAAKIMKDEMNEIDAYNILINSMLGRGIGAYNIPAYNRFIDIDNDTVYNLDESKKTNLADSKIYEQVIQMMKLEINALRHNPLGINAEWVFYTLLKKGYITQYINNNAHIAKSKDKFDIVWKNIFKQLTVHEVKKINKKDNSYAIFDVPVWKNNIYDLNSIILCIMNKLEKSKDACIRIQNYDPMNPPAYLPKDTEHIIFSIDIKRMHGTKSSNKEEYSYFYTEDVYQCGVEWLGLIEPVYINTKTSDLGYLIAYMYKTNTQRFSHKMSELITHSTIQEEIKHWVEEIKYRHEVVEAFKNEFIKLTPKKNKIRYLTCQRTSDEMDDVELYRVLYCERQMTEFIDLVNEISSYINQLIKKQQYFDTEIIESNRQFNNKEIDESTYILKQKNWYDSFIQDFNSIIEKYKKQLTVLYKVKIQEIYSIIETSDQSDNALNATFNIVTNYINEHEINVPDNEFDNLRLMYRALIIYINKNKIKLKKRYKIKQIYKKEGKPKHKRKYTLRNRYQYFYIDNMGISDLEGEMQEISGVIKLNEEIIKHNNIFKSPFIIVKEPYYNSTTLFEDVRSIRTLINPKLAAEYKENLNRELFISILKNLEAFISNVNTLIKQLDSSEDVHIISHDKLDELVIKIQEAKDKEEGHLSDKKESDNKHNGPVNTIKQAYRLAQTIEEKLIEVCHQQGVQVPEKILADMPQKEDTTIGIQLLPPGYGEDGKPLRVPLSNSEQMINTIPLSMRKDKNDIYVWVRPENVFPYGEDRADLLDRYDKACETANKIIKNYKN